MKLQLVSLELAKKLKEVGFNAKVNDFYGMKAPALELAKMWFREQKNIIVTIECNYDLDCFEYILESNPKKPFAFAYSQTKIEFDSYEEALEAGLFKACELNETT